MQQQADFFFRQRNFPREKSIGYVRILRKIYYITSMRINSSTYLVIISIIGMISCGRQNRVSENKSSVIHDSSSVKLNHDGLEELPSASDIKADSTTSTTGNIVASEQPADTLRSSIKAKSKEKEPKTDKEKKPKTIDDGATRYFFKEGKLSVKVDPWDKNQQRKIHFYDTQGEETFTLEDVQQSYSVNTDLSFQDNGAARIAEISINPGASQFWYIEKITFDQNNYPLQKSSQRMPYDDLQSTMVQPKTWNRSKKEWE